MAMHKSKKTKRFQPGGLVDERGKAVLDGSNKPIMTGSFPEEDEITARGRAKNAEMFRSLFNRATGQGKSAQDEAGKVAQMAAAEKKLAQDVQNKLKVDKAAKDDADFAEADRMSSTARSVAGKPAKKAAPSAKAKSGIVTKEELEKSGLSLRDYMNKQRGLTRRDGAAPAKTPSKATTETKPASTAKSAYEADQRKRSDMIVALTKAEREATTPLAKQKIAESKRKMLDEYATAGKADERKNYVPRATPGARAPKQTTSKAKPYMPEKPDMSFRKGGSVSSASKRADGCAVRGKTKCKVY